MGKWDRVYQCNLSAKNAEYSIIVKSCNCHSCTVYQSDVKTEQSVELVFSALIRVISPLHISKLIVSREVLCKGKFSDRELEIRRKTELGD